MSTTIQLSEGKEMSRLVLIHAVVDEGDENGVLAVPGPKSVEVVGAIANIIWIDQHGLRAAFLLLC